MIRIDAPEIDAAEVKRLLLKVYRDYKRGELSESQAFKEANLLQGILKAIELTDLEERLHKIERLLK